MESKNEEGQRKHNLDLEDFPAMDWKKDCSGDCYSSFTVEIGKGKSLKVALDTEVRYLRISKISLGKDIVENEENGPVYLYKTAYKTDKSAKQVIGTLYSKDLRDLEMKLILKNEDLELSHSWDNGSLILQGLIADDSFHANYKIPKIDVVPIWMQLLALKMNTEDVKVMAEKMRKLVAEKKSEDDEMMAGEMRRMLADKMSSKDAKKVAWLSMEILKRVEKENSEKCL